MVTRTYGQFCPASYALDVLGDRWTLLVLRELLFGPRRYSDLQRGLPGMASNLLSRRLKELDEAGMIRQRTLPPPAAVSVYELTDYGHTTKGVINALTEWGLHLVRDGTYHEDFGGVIPVLNALNILFDSGLAHNTTLTCEIRSESEVFSLAVNHGRLSIQPGAALAPDLILETEPKALLMLALGGLDRAQAVKDGLIQLEEGDEAALQLFVELFRFREPITG